MPLCPVCLLVLGATLRGCCGLHSLHYFYLQLEPSQGLTWSLIRGYLDDEPITHFDSLTGRVEPLVPWMEEVEKEAFLPLKWIFRSELEKLSRLNHLSDGLHTWQVILGCELRENGSQGGFLRYGYDGSDFIHFNKENLTWVAAHPQALKFKKEWEDDPRWTQENKVYLEETCVAWLNTYLPYRKKALKKTDAPVWKVTHKVNGSLVVLICQAFGFYPKEIRATWMRDGEVCEYETLRRNLAPNSDGTYYARLSIEIDPKERERFWCHLEHEGLQEPLVSAWKEEPATAWQICVGTIGGLIVGATIISLIYRCWRDGRIFRQKVTSADFPLEAVYVSSNIEEEEIQSESMLQSKVTAEGRTFYEWSKRQVNLEVPGSTLRKREGKKLKRSLSWAGNLDEDRPLLEDLPSCPMSVPH